LTGFGKKASQFEKSGWATGWHPSPS